MNFEEKKLQEMELLLAQSIKGIHHLFDNKDVAKILHKPTEDLDFFNYNNMDRIQDLFTAFIQCDSLDAKRNFLRGLDSESYEILVRTYFHIVDNTVLASTPHRH